MLSRRPRDTALEAAAGARCCERENPRGPRPAAGDVGGARAAMVDATAVEARAGRGHDSSLTLAAAFDLAVVALYAGDGGVPAAGCAALHRPGRAPRRRRLRVAVLANLSVAAAHARDGDRAFASRWTRDARRRA